MCTCIWACSCSWGKMGKGHVACVFSVCMCMDTCGVHMFEEMFTN